MVVLIGITAVVLVLGSGFYIRQRNIDDAKTYIVRVNGEGITRLEYVKELAITKHFFVWAKQDVGKLPSLEKDVLDRMVEMKIISQYANKNKIVVSQKEIEDRFKVSLGKKSESEFLTTINEMYGMDKNDYLQNLSNDLLKEKVQGKLGEPLAVWLVKMKKTVSIKYSAVVD